MEKNYFNVEKDIVLPNRDGIKTFLRFIKDGVYLLISEIDTMGVTYAPNNNEVIIAVDPAGGPFINIGDSIEGVVVKEIKHSKELGGFVIYTW